MLTCNQIAVSRILGVAPNIVPKDSREYHKWLQDNGYNAVLVTKPTQIPLGTRKCIALMKSKRHPNALHVEAVRLGCVKLSDSLYTPEDIIAYEYFERILEPSYA